MKAIYKSLNAYYTEKVNLHGAQPKGVDWNGVESQYIRFQQLTKIIDESEKFSINDLGCGYGELVTYLNDRAYKNYSYTGYDISAAMVKEAYKSNAGKENIKFVTIEDSTEMKLADYTVASGIFNTKQNHNEEDWQNYLFYTIQKMNEKSVKGFSFNALTKYSDQDKMREDLFYADPCELFDYCKKNYSKNVALLHDYNLYEFTIIVRKQSG